MKIKCLTIICLGICLILGNLVLAETRMVPEYRCLWIGPEEGEWGNAGGDANEVWEAYLFSASDADGYLISWELLQDAPYTWPDFISMAEFKDGAKVFVNDPPFDAIQGLVIRDAEVTLNNSLTVVGDSQDDGFMAVCVGQGADGVLNINGGTLTIGNSEDGPLDGQTGPINNGDGKSRFFVGRGITNSGSAKGTVNQTGGKVTMYHALQIGDIDYGEARELLGGPSGWDNASDEVKAAIGGSSAGSTYNLYDGVFETTRNIEIGKAGNSYGIMNVYGGKVHVGDRLRAYYNGELNIDGGSVYVQNRMVWPRKSPSEATLTIRSGSFSCNDCDACERGKGVSVVNILGGTFDCRTAWRAIGSGGEAATQQTIKVDCGNIGWVHFGSLDANLDAGDEMNLVFIVPKDKDPMNQGKVWVDGDLDLGHNGTNIKIDVPENFAGQVGDRWDVMQIGGNVNGWDSINVVNVSAKYSFKVDLVEKYGAKVVVAQLTAIN